MARKATPKEVAHAARDHSALSPSGLKRGMACPGSVMLEDSMPRTTSAYADEGTEAHELAQSVLTGKPYPKHSPEMLDFVLTYTEFCVDECQEKGDVFIVEERLNLGHLAPDMFGTLDFGRWRPSTGELLVVDLKYGAGVYVPAASNPQLMAYASGLARHLNVQPTTVRLVVIQPRQEDPIRQWTMDGLDLFDFEQDVRAAATVIFGENPPFNPGEWCRFCKAAAKCPAMRQRAQSIALEDLADNAPAPEEMDADALGEVVKLAHVMAAWATSVIEFAEAEAAAGKCPTGFDWVPTRPTRKWKDDEEATRFLAGAGVPDEFYLNKPKIRTPLQVEKAVSKILKDDEMAELKEHVSLVSGGHKLVPLKGAMRQSQAVALEELTGEVDFLS